MYLLDTDTIIYSLKGEQAVVNNLGLHMGDPLRICSVTLMELYYGAYKSHRTTSNIAKVRQIENVFDIIPVNRALAETFGSLKAALEVQGTPLDDFDLTIAACALSHNLILVTNNEKHFQRIDGLRIENWTKPGPRP